MGGVNPNPRGRKSLWRLFQVKPIIQALTDQSQIVPFQPEMTPLSLQTGQDQEIACCSSIKAIISPGHGLCLNFFLHRTPVAKAFPRRVDTFFTILPK